MDRYTLEYGRESKEDAEVKVFIYDNDLLERVSEFYTLDNISLIDGLLSSLNKN